MNRTKAVREFDKDIRRLAAQGRTYSQIAAAINVGSDRIRSYCWRQKINVQPAVAGRRAPVGPGDLLALLAGMARHHKPCLNGPGIARLLGVGSSTAFRWMKELQGAGKVAVERDFVERTRRIHVTGIGWTDWCEQDEAATVRKNGGLRLRPDHEVFAGVRFDEAPVSRDPRRAPLIATYVPQQGA